MYQPVALSKKKKSAKINWGVLTRNLCVVMVAGPVEGMSGAD